MLKIPLLFVALLATIIVSLEVVIPVLTIAIMVLLPLSVPAIFIRRM